MMAYISHEVLMHLQHIDKNGIPDVLKDEHNYRVFSALVKQNFYDLPAHQRMHILHKLDMYPPPHHLNFFSFFWNNTVYEDIIQLISSFLKIPVANATLLLGYFLHIEPEHCFFSNNSKQQFQIFYVDIYKNIPNYLIIDSKVYGLSTIISLTDYSDEIEQQIVWYTHFLNLKNTSISPYRIMCCYQNYFNSCPVAQSNHVKKPCRHFPNQHVCCVIRQEDCQASQPIPLIDHLEQSTSDYKDSFCLHASRCKIRTIINSWNNFNPIISESSVMRIGTQPFLILPFSRYEMAKNTSYPVLMFLNHDVATFFQQQTSYFNTYNTKNHKQALIDQTQIIPSGYLSYDICPPKDLKYEDFMHRLVVVVPNPTKEGLLFALNWAFEFQKSAGTNIKVFYKNQIRVADYAYDTEEKRIWKIKLWKDQESIFIDESNYIEIAKQLVEQAESIEQYQNVLKGIGLLKADTTDTTSKNFTLNAVAPSRKFANDKSEPVTLEKLFSHDEPTLIWGETNTGKSFVALEFSLALATGTEAFGLKSEKSHNVYFFDGEVSKEKQFKHLWQLCRKDTKREKTIFNGDDDEKSIRPWNRISGSELPGKFDTDFAIKILEQLKQNNIKYIFIDNLESLDKSAANYNADHLHEFAKILAKKLKISVIVVHHSDKEGKDPKGPGSLKSLFKNIIKVEKCEDVEKLNLDESVKNDITTQKWLVSSFHFEKTKIRPDELSRDTVTYYLPPGKPWQHAQGSFLPAQSNSSKTDFQQLPKEEDAYDRIPEDIKRKIQSGPKHTEAVFKAILSFGNEGAQISQLREKTGLTSDQIRPAREHLQSENLISKTGETSDVRYRISENILSIPPDQ